MQKLKAKRKLTNTFQKGQLEHIQGQTNEIRNLVEDKQSQIAWQTLNEVSGKKNNLRTKLKAGVKLGQFIEEELDVVLKNIKNRKAASLNKIPSEH